MTNPAAKIYEFGQEDRATGRVLDRARDFCVAAGAVGGLTESELNHRLFSPEAIENVEKAFAWADAMRPECP